MVDVNNRLWPAGVTAVTLHSFIIATLAFGMNSSQGARQNDSKQDFCVEVAFITEAKPETAAALEQDTQIPESGEPDQGLETQRKPVKKIVSQKASVKRSFAPFDVQKNFQPGLSKRDETPVHNPPPTYPREARRKKIEGVVLARLFLTASGRVEKVAILPPHTDPVLEEAALRALPHWRFAPGARTVDIPIEFRLQG